MEFVVLAKVVPPADRMTFDPARRTAHRPAGELFVNPFDQRGIAAALSVRRLGEPVTILSMGPPAAIDVLKEGVPEGVDRVVLVSDPVLAGSDSLVTARVLARALERLPYGLVVAGLASTDSETGQLGPQVAGLLGIPVLSGVQTLERAAGADEFLVGTDDDRGTWRWSARTPLLLAVGEKVAKLIKASPEEIDRRRQRAVTVWSSAELGFSPEDVGLEASPTRVVALSSPAPSRQPSVFADGSPEERVRGAISELRRRLAAPPRSEPRPLPWRSGTEPDREVMVWVTDAEGRLQNDATQLLRAVRRTLPGYWPSAVWIGPRPTDSDRDAIEAAGAGAGYLVPVPVDGLDSCTAARGLERLLTQGPAPAAVLFRADPFGREVAGQVAARRSVGLVGDVVSWNGAPDRSIRWEKPAFGGDWIATIEVRGRPAFATIRPGTFEFAPAPEDAAPACAWTHVPPPESPSPFVRLERTERASSVSDGIERARRLVVAGMGVAAPGALESVAEDAALWGASLGGTRRLVDAGRLPRYAQIGLTGRHVAPDLAILVGVSGSANHLVGLRRARVLLAINPDRSAKVFGSVDVGIVGAYEEIRPFLRAALTTTASPRGK